MLICNYAQAFFKQIIISHKQYIMDQHVYTTIMVRYTGRTTVWLPPTSSLYTKLRFLITLKRKGQNNNNEFIYFYDPKLSLLIIVVWHEEGNACCFI